MHHFFAYLSRMRHIRRWGLMRNTIAENDAEHSAQVAFITHALCVLAQVRYGKQVDTGLAVELALYHDAGEVITGDMATPVKYVNPALRNAYKEIEEMASQRLMGMLPEDLKDAYAPLLFPDTGTAEWALVKAADRISAYTKCLEELKMGNEDFRKAAQRVRESIDAIDLPEVRDFMEEFIPGFTLSLDEMN